MTLSDIRSINDLSKLLEVEVRLITYYAYSKSKKYKTFTIAKKSGGVRVISSPVKGLKEIQHKIYNALKPFYSPRNCVHGYVSKDIVKNRSIVSNAGVHENQRWLGKVDIKNFYPSIHTGRIIGLFKSSPLNLPHELALILAKLCTYQNQLPQGAPPSPILSNLVARSIDSKLTALARKNRCYYSRYADDIFISTNQRVFPNNILFYDRNGLVSIGYELENIFKIVDFEINLSKVSLKNKSKRQIVTGIVVNDIKNVPREHIREIRAMLYSWKKYGLDKAEKHWQENVDKVNRVAQASSSFKLAVRGKIEHIAAVKGKLDDIYLKYAKKLAKLDKDYRLSTSFTNQINQVCVFTEGKTDASHLNAALTYFHAREEFLDIKLVFAKNKKGEGDQSLKSLIEYLPSTKQHKVTIGLFDHDNPEIIKSMKGSNTDFKDHGNNVFSIVIPIPSFRKDMEHICIEHYYKNEDLLKEDDKSRRLYLKEEFDPKNGVHNSKKCTVNIRMKGKGKGNLIVDSDVIDSLKKENVALSKMAFAEYIKDRKPPFHEVDFSEFKVIFNIIKEIQENYIDYYNS